MTAIHRGWHHANAARQHRKSERPDIPAVPRIPQFAERWSKLTHRQRHILTLRAAGRSLVEIANELSITDSTVKNHMWRAARALGVGRGTDHQYSNTTQRIAYELGRMDERNASS
jgi:DNA-binding NarL/FixJ family response regulator